MIESDFNRLAAGDAIRIRFGRTASQFAIVHSWTREGNCRVMKYSFTRDVWKGPLRVTSSEVIERASAHDKAQHRAPRSFPAMGRSYPRNPLEARS
jgi:hypothetical protein